MALSASALDRPHADPMRRCELHDAGLALPQTGPDRSFFPGVDGPAAQPLALRPCALQPRPYPLLDHRTLKLGEDAHHLE
jgi:hypothetical protein